MDTTIATLLFSVVVYGSYLLLEPSAIKAQSVGKDITISQQITSEISLVTSPQNVTMGAIAGISGGASFGQTQLAVYTNNALGFTVTLTASSAPAMLGATGGGSISNYTPVSASIPDFAFASNTTGQASEFGYSVSASSTSDLAQKFLDNGSACNVGSSDTGGSSSCWYNASTTATSTLNRTTSTLGSGATSTIFFRVNVPSNPAPTLPQATYIATTTITATLN